MFHVLHSVNLHSQLSIKQADKQSMSTYRRLHQPASVNNTTHHASNCQSNRQTGNQCQLTGCFICQSHNTSCITQFKCNLCYRASAVRLPASAASEAACLSSPWVRIKKGWRPSKHTNNSNLWVCVWHYGYKWIHPTLIPHLIYDSLDPHESTPRWHLNQFNGGFCTHTQNNETAELWHQYTGNS